MNKSTLSNKTLLHLALIVLLGFLVYSNTFTVPFVFDDEAIMKSPRFRDITTVPSMFVEITGPWASRPLLHATMAVNNYFGGLDTTGYHAVNLAFHLINCLLFYFVILMTGRQIGRNDEDLRPVAFLSSAVFVLHPLQTEAVTYVVSRSILMATCFYFAGLILFLKAATSARRRWPYAAGLFLVSFFGMASRENFATFPLMLFLYDMFFISKFRLREAAGRYGVYLPVLLSFGYFVFLALNNTYAESSSHPGTGLTPAEYVLTAINVHLTYLRLIVLPIGQNIDYGYRVASGLFEYQSLISLLCYIGLWVFGIVFVRRRPVAAFATLWFLITLIPVSFGAPLIGGLRLDDVIFEHRLYLPNAGAIMAIAAATDVLLRKIGSKKIRMAAIVIIAVFPLVLATAAYVRNGVWQSKISMWKDVAEKSPNWWRGHYNLANEYAAVGMNDDALVQYSTSIGLAPNVLAPHVNMANIFLKRGLYDKAIEEYQIAIRLMPDDFLSYYNMGTAYYYKRQYDKAIENYKTVIKLKPDHADAHNDLGATYFKLGLNELARKEFEEALRINPNLLEARRALLFLASPETGAGGKR